MSARRSWIAPWTRLGILCAIAGCSAPAPVGQLSGVVTIDAQPAEEMLVVLRAKFDAPTGALRVSGVTDRQGRFTLRRDDGSHDLLAGEYQVSCEDLRLYENPRNDQPGASGMHVDRLLGRALVAPREARCTVREGAQVLELSFGR